MEPRHHGLEHQAAIRPRPSLTRLRCAGPAGRSSGNADLRPINHFPAPIQRRRRPNPPKSFSAINPNAQSDRLLEALADPAKRAGGFEAEHNAVPYGCDPRSRR